MDHEKIADHLNRSDRFCAVNGIRIVKISPGYAEAELTVTPDLLNGVGTVQGGAIFTLADFAFAGAANAGNEAMVTLSSTINFIRPGTGGKLRAVAREVSRGRRTGVYNIEVFNADGKLVADIVNTGFATGTPLLPE